MDTLIEGIQEGQYGFIPGAGYDFCLLEVLTLVNIGLMQTGVVGMTSYDATKFYPSIQTTLLLRDHIIKEIEPEVVNMVADSFYNRSSSLKTGRVIYTNEAISECHGLREGGLWSPAQSLLVQDELAKTSQMMGKGIEVQEGKKIGLVLQADDAISIGNNVYAQTKLVMETVKISHVRLNKGKCATMFMTNGVDGEMIKNRYEKMEDLGIPVVEKLDYLGMQMTNGNNERINAELKRQKTRAIMATCSAIAWMNERRITVEARNNMGESYIVSKFLGGLACFGLTGEEEAISETESSERDWEYIL